MSMGDPPNIQMSHRRYVSRSPTWRSVPVGHPIDSPPGTRGREERSSAAKRARTTTPRQAWGRAACQGLPFDLRTSHCLLGKYPKVALLFGEIWEQRVAPNSSKNVDSVLRGPLHVQPEGATRPRQKRAAPAISVHKMGSSGRIQGEPATQEWPERRCGWFCVDFFMLPAWQESCLVSWRSLYVGWVNRQTNTEVHKSTRNP